MTGSKIFISSGDHDMADNIIHIVLARLPDAPEGTKGISLFIVPKIIEGQSNKVVCSALEKKMGIHGNATCVLNFDGSKGYLIGPENKGLHCMFTFMNYARVATAIQGIAGAELAYQGSLEYAKERLAMRSISGIKNPSGPADPILVHADVRRMILTQRCFAQGGRTLLYMAAIWVDQSKAGGEQKQQADAFLGFVTPILKAFLTEAGCEAANLGIQVYGGHGYIKEHGMEQIVRDVKIATLYEGTTGIQALDLIGRKVLANRGEHLKAWIKEMQALCKEGKRHRRLKSIADRLLKQTKEWASITFKLGLKARKDRYEVGAASYDYLMYAGYSCLGYAWLKMAITAQNALDAEKDDADYYRQVIATAEFYFKRVLPRTRGHKDAMLAGGEWMMNEELF